MDIYRGESLSRALLALLIVAGLCVAIFQSPFLVKQLGDVLLIVPEAPGMIRRVSPGEVMRLELRSMPRAAIDFRTAGRYLVYASDVFLLVELAQSEEGLPG